MNFMETNEKRNANVVTQNRTPVGGVASKFAPTPTHPEGEYDGTIKMAKVKTHEKKGEYVMMVIETRGGTAFSSLYFNDTTKAFMDSDGVTPVTFQDLARRELKRIILSAYKKTATPPSQLGSLVEVAAALKGLPVRIKVTHKPYNGKNYANVRFGKVNEIDRIDGKQQADLLVVDGTEESEELGF